jgi:protein-S-isoprenylcysteine O-methyltransferase
MSGASGSGSAIGPSFSAPVELPESSQNGGSHLQPFQSHMPDAVYLPGGKRSLSGISVRAFSLGVALGVAGTAAAQLAYHGIALWRAPFFIATLALFHYLEFDSTARFNPSDAKVSSFLLSANGSAYNSAHTAAFTELLVRHWLHSALKPSWLRLPFELPALFPSVPSAVPVSIGLALIILGQYVRTAAMAKAGKSFNHIVQSTKKDDHVLVTSGVYAFSRHPSYFGFFWWGLGTQLVLGNPICFAVYALVLWKFFAYRIQSRSSSTQALLSKLTAVHRGGTVSHPVLWP